MPEDHAGTRYRPLFEDHPFPMWVYDPETLRFLDVNAAALTHYGYSTDEFRAMTVADIRPPEDVPGPPARGRGDTGVFRHRRKDGTLIDVEVTSSPTTFAGRPARAVVVVDVTERRRLEAERDRLVGEIAAREADYEALAENNPDVLVRFDRDGRFLYANRAIEAHTGLPPEAFVGRTIADLGFSPAHQELWGGALRRALETGVPQAIRYAFSPATGEAERWYESVLAAERRGPDGSPETVIGIARDVTEGRRSEDALRASADALRASEERLRLALSGAGLGTWEHDLAADVSTFDERAAAIIGWPAGEPRIVAGEERLATVHPDDQAEVLAAFAEAVASENGEYQVEYRTVSPGGAGYRWISARASVQKDPAGRPARVVGVMRDVTEEKEAAQRQRRFLREMLFSLTEGRLRLLGDADEAPRLLPPAPEGAGPFDLTVPAALRALRRSALAAAEAAGLSEERRYDLETALTEAATNALKHAGGGTAEVRCDPAAGAVQVVVRDAGAGIPDEHIHRATLDKGYSTAGTLGHGFWLMLKTADRVSLLTGMGGTTVFVEQFRTPPDPAWLRAAPDLESFPADAGVGLLGRKLDPGTGA